MLAKRRADIVKHWNQWRYEMGAFGKKEKERKKMEADTALFKIIRSFFSPERAEDFSDIVMRCLYRAYESIIHFH